MKRGIDEIYRDRFKHLETPPPAESWENITAALPKKEKKRILPFWYKLAGTAAAIGLLFSLYNIFLPGGNNEITRNVSVETKKKVFYLDPVSQNFEESMRLSSTILEKLKIETWNKIIENRIMGQSSITTHNNDVAGQPDVEIEDITPIKSNSIPESIISVISGIEELREDGSDNSLVADVLKIEEPDNGIELLVQSDSEKENTFDNSVVEKSNLKRLSIRPTAGAVYFDNFGDGNSLDPAYAQNKSSGEFTMAYGINLAYQVTPKWNIRTGVNKVNLSHNTSNIAFGVATISSNLNSDVGTTVLAWSEGSNGYLNQSLEYIEVPLEFEYSILDNKMGLNIIGGASTFFLDGNMVSHNSTFATTELGEANNLNDLSFSANIGVGLNYNFSTRFQFNLEPILKYQINTFNNGSGLTPYIFGIYSGFSFKF